MMKYLLLLSIITFHQTTYAQNQKVLDFIEYNNLEEHENIILIGINPGYRKSDISFLESILTISDSLIFHKVIILLVQTRQSEIDSFFEKVYQINKPPISLIISDSLFNYFSMDGSSFILSINKNRQLRKTLFMQGYPFLKERLLAEQYAKLPYKLFRIKTKSLCDVSRYAYVARSRNRFIIIDPIKDNWIEMTDSFEIYDKRKIDYKYHRIFNDFYNDQFNLSLSKFIEYSNRIKNPDKHILFSYLQLDTSILFLAQYSYGLREANRFKRDVNDVDTVFGIYSYVLLFEVDDSIKISMLPKYGFPVSDVNGNGSYGTQSVLYRSGEDSYYFSVQNNYRHMSVSDSLYLIAIFTKEGGKLIFDKFLEYKIPDTIASYWSYYSRFEPLMFDYLDSVYLYDNVANTFSLVINSQVISTTKFSGITNSFSGKIIKCQRENNSLFLLTSKDNDYVFYRSDLQNTGSIEKIILPEYFSIKSKFLIHNSALYAFRFDDFYFDIGIFDF